MNLNVSESMQVCLNHIKNTGREVTMHDIKTLYIDMDMHSLNFEVGKLEHY